MSKTHRYEAQQSTLEACCRQLTTEGIIEPLSTDGGDTKTWMLRELASLVEGHLHVQLDVTRLSEEDRLAYERRISSDDRPLPSPHNEYSRPFWLLAGTRRVGTIAIGTMYYGSNLVSIASLHVDPAQRRRNIARRALEGVFRAALAKGANGIRLDASWTWQPSVRFYARIGMWVRMWKHNLVFTWQPDLPPYQVEIGDSQARFLIHQEDRWRAVVTARNLGERLGWETGDLGSLPREMSHCIPGTFALHLALAGWPLVRSEEAWEHRHYWSDSGEPEGLAYKIEIFEAVFRERGFEIRTPRIPGLKYRDLDEIE